MSHTKLKLLLAVLSAMCAPAFAQTEHGSSSDREAAHDFHRNFVAAFVGVTHEGRRDNGAALGIAYERRLNESLGIGVIAEYTFGDLVGVVFGKAF